MNCSLPGSSVHGISQNSTGVDCRFLLRGIFQPRDWTQVSRSIDRCFTIWATREVGTTQFCSGFFSPLSLTEVTQEKLKQFQCVSPWFYLNEDSSLKRYKSILYKWPNFYWFIHHCIKIPYFTEKVQAAKFQFSLQHKTGLYLTGGCKYIRRCTWIRSVIGKSHKPCKGTKKNKQKLCDLETIHPFTELKRSTVLSRELYLQVS